MEPNEPKRFVRIPLLHRDFTPKQYDIAHYAWERVGHFFETWETFEKNALSEFRINFQLAIWVNIAWAWERYFRRHPNQQFREVEVASMMIHISLGEPRRHWNKKRWAECKRIYEELAAELDLPPSAPVQAGRIPPGEYKLGEDLPMVCGEEERATE